MTTVWTSSPWGFRTMSFSAYCRAMRDLGIDSICTMFGDPRQWPVAILPTLSEVEAARACAREAGLRVLEVAIGDDWSRQIPLAAALGAKFVRICSVWPDNETTWKALRQLLCDCGALAESNGLTVVLENHGGLLTKALKCRRLLEAVNRKNVKLNYDPANFLYYGDHPRRALEEVGSWVGFTHFKSVRLQDGQASYCRIREGLLDYRGILQDLLCRYGYRGPLGLEYEMPEDVVQGTQDDWADLRQALAEVPATAQPLI